MKHVHVPVNAKSCKRPSSMPALVRYAVTIGGEDDIAGSSGAHGSVTFYDSEHDALVEVADAAAAGLPVRLWRDVAFKLRHVAEVDE